MIWIALICYAAVAVIVFGFACAYSEWEALLPISVLIAVAWPVTVLFGVGLSLGEKWRQMDKATPDKEE